MEPCKYEGEIASMATSIKHIADTLKKQNRNLEKLFKKLEGNGSVGIITQTALNKASIYRLWWFIPIAVVAVGVLVGVII